jgi:nucleoside-diphosphate-sugar epimerase
VRILIAGGSGTIGLPLVRALAASGHEVSALARSAARQPDVDRLGGSLVVADALNRAAVMAAVRQLRPTHVIHQLTALPKDGPRRRGDLHATNRLRVDGTRHLLEAAIQAGARRFVVGSFALLASREAVARGPEDEAAAAVRSMEHQVLEATRNGAIGGVVLRYGLFYGPDVPSTVSMVAMIRKRRLPVVRGDAGQLPLVHVDDAVSATVCALDAAPAGAIYDIVDDQPMSLSGVVRAIAASTGSAAPLQVPAWLPRLVAPYFAGLTSMRLSLSNARARQELGWRPRYSTVREGLAQLSRRVA